ncbi:MAG: DNA replication/repair protein RecF [Gammaproteobacteria bacterium]
MKLWRLEIRNLRILRTLSISPSPSLNLFVGPNGSGKTSVLEGIHLLGLGRSFRTRYIREAVARDGGELLAFGEVGLDDGRTVRIGVERQRTGRRIRIDGQDVCAASELARTMPLFMLTPHGQWLLAEGAEQRRRLMDWTLFHVEPSYLTVLQRYHHVLRQRNAQLKQPKVAELTAWNQQLGQSGEVVHSFRQHYLSQLAPRLEAILGDLLATPIELAYTPGWDARSTLHTALTDATTEDRFRGYTTVGPHRADLQFRIGTSPAHRLLSRGETKLLVLGFLLAQVDCVIDSVSKTPIVLIDDLPSELDALSRHRFMRSLAQRKAQTFFTALPDSPIDTSCWPDARIFPIRHGQIEAAAA